MLVQFREYSDISKELTIIAINKEQMEQKAYGPHRSPEKPDQINEYILAKL